MSFVSDDVDARAIQQRLRKLGKGLKGYPSGCTETLLIREAADEIERLRHEIDVQCSSEYVERILKENERLRAALAKSCEEGRDEMYDCGYNRLRAALYEIKLYGGPQGLIARDALREADDGH